MRSRKRRGGGPSIRAGFAGVRGACAGRRAGLAACALFLAAAQRAQGVEYRLDGSMALGQQYNSNLLLSQPAEAAAATGLDLLGGLSAGEEDWGASGKLRLSNWFYASSNNIDLQNEYFDVDAFLLGERSRWSLAGNVTDDTILSSQTDGTQGLILTRARRDTQSVAPSWSYSLDEKNQASLGYTYSHSRYHYADGRMISADNHTVSSSFAHQFNERFSASESLSYTRYDSQSTYQYISDYVSFSQGLKYALTPTVALAFSGGLQHSQTQQIFRQPATFLLNGRLVTQVPPSVKNSQLWPLLNVSASKRFETADLALSYSRQITPSVNGVLLQVDSFSLGGNKQFSEVLTGGLSLAYSHQYGTQSINTVGVSDYAYYSASGDLGYRFSGNLALSASYRYQLRQLSGAASQNTDNHVVFLNIKYEFDSKYF